ncbi:TadE/TadG family type IV pilus assembly protein [Actinospongicola halichondriae]|uniref:TadE/TadG family type IV pilus assembly protein n=1 Tax=Actinospongicola halichondriae TaxID=3236844 RepID=UPI003D3D7435
MKLRRRNEDGAALVEFALVLPLLVLFLFGIVQFGLAFDMKQSINAAAREGSRTAAIPVSTVSQVEDSVENGFDGILDGTVSTTITVNGGAPILDPTAKPCEGNAGLTVVVVAQVDHTLTIPFYGAPDITLEGRGEFRCELA